MIHVCDDDDDDFSYNLIKRSCERGMVTLKYRKTAKYMKQKKEAKQK